MNEITTIESKEEVATNKIKVVRTKNRMLVADVKIIVYSNELNTYDLSALSVLQRRFLFLCLSRIEEDDEEGKDIVIKKSDIVKYANVSRCTKDKFQKIMDEFASTVMGLVIFKPDDKDFEAIHIARKVKWIDSEQELHFQLDEEAKIFKKNLTGGKNTMFELTEFSSISSTLGQVLYQLMKQWRTVGCTPKIELDELRKTTGTTESKKKGNSRFLEQIEKNLENMQNRNIFSNITLEKVKGSSTNEITHIIIRFDKEEKNIYPIALPDNKEPEKPDEPKANDFIDNIEGLTNENYKALVAKYGDEKVAKVKERYLSYNYKKYSFDELQKWLEEDKNRQNNSLPSSIYGPDKEDEARLKHKIKNSSEDKRISYDVEELELIFPHTYQGIPYDCLEPRKYQEAHEDLKLFRSGVITAKEYADKWNNGIYREDLVK